MFGDTLTMANPAGNKVLNKINQDGYSSEYLLKETASEFRVKIRHSSTNAGQDRHNVEYTENVYSTETDPEFTRKCYFVIENPPSDSDDENARGLGAMLSAAADLAKLFGWQS